MNDSQLNWFWYQNISVGDSGLEWSISTFIGSSAQLPVSLGYYIEHSYEAMALSEIVLPSSKTTRKSTAKPGPQSNWETTDAGSSLAKVLHPDLYKDGRISIRDGPPIRSWDVYFSVLWNVLSRTADTWTFLQIEPEKEILPKTWITEKSWVVKLDE